MRWFSALRIHAALEDDVRRVRVLQSDYDDTTRILEELQRALAKIDDQREDILDGIDEQRAELKRIDAELSRYPRDVIDAA